MYGMVQALEKEFISWKAEYSLGIPHIDEQHKRLVFLINELNESLDSSDTHDSTLEVLLSLRDYTVYHFAEEERLMMEYNYPNLIAHREEHKLFIEDINDLCFDFKNGHKITTKLLDFLKNWLIDHILGTDQDYAKSINR